MRNRIVEVVASWFPDDPGPAYSPRVLTNVSLDLAVAQGAAYYGVVRRGGGIRIGGGTARSFYVGLETQQASRPWMCVVPRDAQEGDEITIDGHDFDLLMGQPVVFPLASSSVRPDDKPGDLVAADPDSIRELPPLQSLMRVGRKAKAERVPVSLAARVTEVGTIELWCQSRTDARRWRLQIQLRGPAGQPPPRAVVAGEETDRVIIEQSELDAAIAAIRAAFGAPPSAAGSETGPARLIKRLEELLDVPRDQWPPSALRAWWEPLRDLADQRLKSPQHESRWFNLAGFSLRPGRGYPLDEIRLKALWPVFHQGVKHTKDVQCWAEWWILWRRVAAGLSRQHHDEIYRRIAPFLLPAKGTSPSKKAGRPKPEPHELAEMWRCAASLERLAPEVKEGLGGPLVKELSRPDRAGLRPLVPGTPRRSRPALRTGQHRGPPRGRRALDRCFLLDPAIRPRPRDQRRHLRPVSARSLLGRPCARPARRASRAGAGPPRAARRRRDRPPSRPRVPRARSRPGKPWPWATPCRSACGCVKRIHNPLRLLILRRAEARESLP